MRALSWSASPRTVRRPHLPVARRGGAPAVDVSKRAQRRHGRAAFGYEQTREAAIAAFTRANRET